MACRFPLHGYALSVANVETGKFPTSFDAGDWSPVGTGDNRRVLPCGKCPTCKAKYARDWAIRMVHEAQCWPRNVFITLTYRPECLPLDAVLVKKDFQDFMKRLRKRFGAGIRFFHCGEYGKRKGRPHYHAILFNFDFEDRVAEEFRNGHQYYSSPSLDDLWGKGIARIGEVTLESCGYVARYVNKKLDDDVRYEILDLETGEISLKPREYATMSRRPGIGRLWYDRFALGDVYPHDRVVYKGKELRPPRYYDSLFQIDDPVSFEEIKRKRKSALNLKPFENRLRSRLLAKWKYEDLKFERLKRGYEDETLYCA